jgi:hypothetical protein
VSACVSKVIESLLLLLLLFGQNALRSLISIYDSFSRPNTVKAEKIGWSGPRQAMLSSTLCFLTRMKMQHTGSVKELAGTTKSVT